MTITASEAVCDVADVGAVFSVRISISRELLSAAGAGKMVNGLFVHHFRMRVPPTDTAAIGAELDRLSSGSLHQRLAAATAAVGIQPFFCVGLRLGTGQCIPSAESGYLILGEAQRLCNGRVSVAGLAELFDFKFLFIRHIKTPPLPNGDELRF